MTNPTNRATKSPWDTGNPYTLLTLFPPRDGARSPDRRFSSERANERDNPIRFFNQPRDNGSPSPFSRHLGLYSRENEWDTDPETNYEEEQSTTTFVDLLNNDSITAIIGEYAGRDCFEPAAPLLRKDLPLQQQLATVGCTAFALRVNDLFAEILQRAPVPGKISSLHPEIQKELKTYKSICRVLNLKELICSAEDLRNLIQFFREPLATLYVTKLGINLLQEDSTARSTLWREIEEQQLIHELPCLALKINALMFLLLVQSPCKFKNLSLEIVEKMNKLQTIETVHPGILKQLFATSRNATLSLQFDPECTWSLPQMAASIDCKKLVQLKIEKYDFRAPLNDKKIDLPLLESLELEDCQLPAQNMPFQLAQNIAKVRHLVVRFSHQNSATCLKPIVIEEAAIVNALRTIPKLNHLTYQISALREIQHFVYIATKISAEQKVTLVATCHGITLLDQKNERIAIFKYPLPPPTRPRVTWC
ncbi:MAG TPA: hypothetical protein VN457_04450 [Chlamydiales bacterium]|nr:hypothetical protein [Chlamydiales bacterium]